jgi:putative SbcD/Mre11-related phosphoesterase
MDEPTTKPCHRRDACATMRCHRGASFAMRVLDDWLLTPQRLAIHEPSGTAVAADLHLGYDLSRRRRGDAVPLTSLGEFLSALAQVQPSRLVIAGDLFEDANGRALIPELLRWLSEHTIELTGVVPGNHDGDLARAAPELPVCPAGVRLGDWLIVHGDGVLPKGRIVFGHFHPSLRLTGRLSAPCYLIGTTHLVLPAFSTDAAGVNVLGDPLWSDYRCAAIAGEQILDFGLLSRLTAPPARKR